MTFQVVHQPHPAPAQSPYRIAHQETGREVIWVNRFLDRECVRCLAETTLRSYALDLLHFLRWWMSVHQTDTVIAEAITESTLLEYVRFKPASHPGLRPPPSTDAQWWRIVHSKANSPMPLASSLRAFINSIGNDLL